jgi:hypothetical protein
MITELRRSVQLTTQLIGIAVALITAPAASASTPFVDIHSAGPLTDIYIGNDLGCQVRSGGFSSTEFFPNAAGPGDCGTFVNTGSDDNTEELEGPDFIDHPGGTDTTGNFTTEVPVTPVSQTLTGSGTAASPYQVTTVVTSSDPDPTAGPIVYQLTEVDTYVVGNDFYRTDVTVTNIGSGSTGALQTLYHATDCQLRGFDDGFGTAEPPLGALQTGVACTLAENDNQVREELVPITSGDTWAETTVPLIWNDLANSTLPGGCGSCTVSVDNATGIGWTFSGLAPGASQTFSFETVIVDTVPTGGFSFTGMTGNTIGGTVATITDPNTSATANAYSAAINWGDGTTSTGTIGGGNGSFNVGGNHTYSSAGTYAVSVTITSVGTSQGSSTIADSATITAPPGAPSVSTSAPVVTGPNGAAFSGTVNPDGLATTAYFQYGIPTNAQGPEGPGPKFTEFTPAQTVGPDFSSHVISASASGLVPNQVYEVQLIATNSAGTSYGPVETFTTAQNAPPPPPVLGKQVNVSLVSGHIWIKPPPGETLGPASDSAQLRKGQGFVPLTEARQIPTGSEVDALHGSLKIVTATGKVGKTQNATIAGGVFKLAQTRTGLSKGLTDLALQEGAFQGAPTYGTCKANVRGTRAEDQATIASLSSKTLQLLKASAHGKFKTTGRFSSATVRGTIWTIADRCNGTLTHAIRDTVLVQDFVRHVTVILHAGHSYLARAIATRK